MTDNTKSATAEHLALMAEIDVAIDKAIQEEADAIVTLGAIRARRRTLTARASELMKVYQDYIGNKAVQLEKIAADVEADESLFQPPSAVVIDQPVAPAPKAKRTRKKALESVAPAAIDTTGASERLKNVIAIQRGGK